MQPAEVGETDTWDGQDAAADENMSPEEAMGAITEPDSEWEPPYRGEPGRGDVEAPDKYWATYGYPDFVSFASEAGGELLEDGTVETWWEIGLVGGDAALEEKLLDLLAPTCRARFIRCLYSYDQRQTVLDEILARDDPRITRAVLGRNTEAIFVWTSEADRDAVQSELDADYGPMKVEVLDTMLVEDLTSQGGLYTDGMQPSGTLPIESGQSLTAEAPAAKASPLPWVLTVTAVLLGLGGILLLRRRPSAVTSTGRTVSGAPLSRTAVRRAVRESTQTPRAHVLDALEKQLKK